MLKTWEYMVFIHIQEYLFYTEAKKIDLFDNSEKKIQDIGRYRDVLFVTLIYFGSVMASIF